MTLGAQKIEPEINFGWLDVLSMRDNDALGALNIRNMQFAHMARYTKYRVSSLVIGVLIVAWMLRELAPWWALAGWGVSLIGVTALRVKNRNRYLDVPGIVPLSAARAEMRQALLTSALIALPFAYLAYFQMGAAMSRVWIVYAGTLAMYALCSAMAPFMVVGLMPFVSIVAIGAFIWCGEYEMAAAAVAYCFAITMGVFSSSRRHIQLEISERTATERAETVSLLLREFADTSADWLWQTDASRKLERVSPRFAHALNCEPQAIEGKALLELIAGSKWRQGRLPAAVHDLANRLNRREAFSNLLVPVDVDNQRRWWELSATPRYDEDGRFAGYHGVGSDVTEQQDSADRIAQLARFDALTGLPNRTYLNETLSGALEQAAAWRRRCALMMIDLDRFKSVNDTLGHPVGDRLLAQVAGRIRELCGTDAIAGRLGGDEFAVVIRETSGVEAIEELGMRIVQAVSRPFEVDGHSIYVGASIGYAIGPRDGDSVDELTRNADLALYRSKENGGASVHGYEPTLHDQARERRDIEVELRGALVKNEFEVVYQPVVRADGSVDGFEALLRWTNAKLGSVSPVRFIPVAEDARLIGAIGAWVLQTACREAAGWPGGTKVAVNVSAEQLADPNFVSSVVTALSRSGLHHSRLELEVTESVFMREVAGASAALEQLRGLGVKLSLDDFGTGYSSLGYLRMGQFSTIKVDRSFVQSALKGAQESIAIIRAVVALAENLDMTTTAEGVETADEAAAIIALGCKKLQGYHFGRPMCAADARAMFALPPTAHRSGRAA